ncbi:MAG TPA: hypothetical protein VI704_00855, partial [Bacteroidota bacterium]|nr:hypothetical protein [Bacteroidota bacterium]
NMFEVVEDLLRVEGMTDELLVRIRRYVTVMRPTEYNRGMVVRFLFRSRTETDLQERRGFQNGTYAGSPIKSYNRFLLSYGESSSLARTSKQGVELGMLTEKDPGEQSIKDFLAGYLLVNVPSLSSRLILGDFVVESAEGLVLWRSIGFSKGSEVISPLQKHGSGIRPYLSTDENLFLRGAAVEWKVADVSLSAFHSSKPITGSVNQDGVITGLFSDGYHRTSGELAKKDNSHEQITGLRVQLPHLGGLRVGGTAYQARFDKPLFLNDASGYQNSSVAAGGLDLTYTNKLVSVFSEVAKTGTSSFARILGVVFEPHKRLDVAVIARSYPKDFANPHAFGFRESGSLTQNESGLYVGAKFYATQSLRFSMYFDQFQFPWRTSSLKLPTSGNDFLLLCEIKLSRRTDLQILYKNRHKPFSLSQPDLFGRQREAVRERNQKNYRLTLDFSSSANTEWKSRFEMVDVKYSADVMAERGFLWMQDLRLRTGHDFIIDARVIIFQTDSFDSRVYEFENDLRGTFLNPALFGKGIRWYLLARQRLTGYLELSAKYSRTVKDGAKTISSGSNEIMGDAESQMSFQIDVVF